MVGDLPPKPFLLTFHPCRDRKDVNGRLDQPEPRRTVLLGRIESPRPIRQTEVGVIAFQSRRGN